MSFCQQVKSVPSIWAQENWGQLQASLIQPMDSPCPAGAAAVRANLSNKYLTDDSLPQLLGSAPEPSIILVEVPPWSISR